MAPFVHSIISENLPVICSLDGTSNKQWRRLIYLGAVTQREQSAQSFLRGSLYSNNLILSTSKLHALLPQTALNFCIHLHSLQSKVTGRSQTLGQTSLRCCHLSITKRVQINYRFGHGIFGSEVLLELLVVLMPYVILLFADLWTGRCFAGYNHIQIFAIQHENVALKCQQKAIIMTLQQLWVIYNIAQNSSVILACISNKKLCYCRGTVQSACQ